MNDTGRGGDRYGQWLTPGLENKKNYVGLETDLRKLAVFLSSGWCARAGGIDVRHALALADYLFCDGIVVPCWWARGVAEAARRTY
jgi:hypothetical protein